MEISEGIRIIDLCIYADKTLIIADVHMGFEEALNKQGYLVPVSQYKITIERLEKIFKKLKEEKLEVEKVIINGDLKHEFGKISETEWRNTLNLLDFLSEKCSKITLLKGNHDKVLGPIAEKRNIEIKDSEILSNIFICHGDVIPKEINKEIIIIGHEHPAIGLREDARIETFKCFLKGKWKNKELIVMPSFNLVREGSDMLREETLSPFLNNLEDFEVYVINEKKRPLYFGKISDLR